MLFSYFKIAFRQLARNKVFSGLNILGLALGMALAILIAVFIRSEFSYDTWMEGSELTYRLNRNRGGTGTSWTPSNLAQKLMSDYPEVVAASGQAPSGERLLSYGDKDLYIQETSTVDSTFFNVLGMKFLHGDPATALDQPNSMVITHELAERVFGTDNAIGKVVTYDGEEEFIISGVLDSKGRLSHLRSEIFTRFTWFSESWTGNNRSTYARLHPDVNVPAFETKITKDINKLIEQEYLASNYTPNKEDFFNWGLQPLHEVYLHSSNFNTVMHANGNIDTLYIFGFIAFIVLAVAIINYINLSTAQASQRSKEVGVKKVAGAGRRMLTTQFISESIIQASIAGVFALLLAEIGLPFFNKIIDRELELFSGDPSWVILCTVVLAILVGVIGGSYPAFVMSAFKPATALKANFMRTGNKGIFRKVLVIGQFSASITLLIVMFFIYRQVNFMIEEDLGFQADQVLSIPMSFDDSFRKVERLKSRIKQIQGVQEVTTTSTMPGRFFSDWQVLIEGRPNAISPYVIFTDGDFDNSLDIEMVAGRFIDDNIGADSISNYIVNEEFVKRYNISQPIGQRMKFGFQEAYGQIVGVAKDFHFHDLSREIMPLVMNANSWRNFTGIKLSTANLAETIAALKEIWTEVEPSHPMRYTFLDEDFARQYEEQQRFGKAILYATFLTLFIALLGLIGLTTFTLERRTREIGIRKVLGASVSGIISLISKDFVKLIGFSTLIAVPIGYVLISRWLEDFAHQTELVWWGFAGAGLVILGISFLTVFLQSIRAALANPVESLRSE
ncbi:MAG: ABC transporter permease [Bacteroidota bacterium]